MKQLIYRSFLILFCGGILTLQLQAQPYCGASSEYPWEEWIAGVSLGNLNNASSKFKDYNTLGYSNFTDQAAYLEAGNSFAYTMSLGNSGAPLVMNWAMWIDFNQDGDFTDAGEQLIEQSGGTISGNITIPSSALSGDTRMRVMLVRDNTPLTPCMNFVRGEVEDYTIGILDGGGGGNLADLRLANFNLPANAATNTVVDFTVDLINQGTGMADGNFAVGVYLSTDNVISNDDVSLGEIPTGDFGPGFQVPAVPGAFNLAGIAPATYYVILKIDRGETISESDETNNTISQAFTVTTPIIGGDIDLDLSNFRVTRYDTRSLYLYQYTIDIINNGNTSSPAFDIQLFLSTDPVASNDDQAYNLNTLIDPIGAGQQISYSSTASIFNIETVPNGDYYLIVQIDRQNQVAEFDETNNIAIRPFKKESWGLAMVDLQVENLRASSNLNYNTKSSVLVDIRNTGSIDVNETVKAIVTLNSEAIGGIEIDYLVGIDGLIKDLEIPIDLAGFDPGDYALGVSIGSSPFRDRDNSNNRQSIPLTINSNGLDDQFICTASIQADGSFETGLQNWGTVSGSAQLTTDARNGNQALEICAQVGESALVGTSIPATAGQVHTLYFYAKGKYTGNQINRAYLIYYDANFQRLSTLYNRLFTFEEFKRFELSSRAPAGTVYVGIQFSNPSIDNDCLIIDDICLIPENNSSNCTINATASNVRCNDNGTPVNQLDDTYGFDFTVTGTNTGSGFTYQQVGTFYPNIQVYGESISTKYFADVQAPQAEILIKDLGNENCQTILQVASPGECSDQSSDCDIDFSINVSACNDNGTPDDPRDDHYMITILANGINTSGTYETNFIQGQKYIGSYDIPLVIGPLAIINSSSRPNVFINDSGSISPCSASRSYDLPSVCSTDNPTVCPDNEATNGNFEQDLNGWTIVTFKNTGEQVQPIGRIINNGVSGSKAVEVCSDASNAIFISAATQAIDMQTGDELDLSWSSRRITGTGTVKVVYYDSGDNAIFSDLRNAGGNINQWLLKNTINNFGPAPAGTVRAELWLEVFEGCYAFDEVCYEVIKGNGGGGGPNGTDLELLLTVDQASPGLWQNVTYNLTVLNKGNRSASGIKIDFNSLAQLSPKKLALVSQTDPTYNAWDGTWDIPFLAAGEAKSFDLTLFVLAAAAPSTTLTASVTALNETDVDNTNDSAAATININNNSIINSSTRAGHTNSSLVPEAAALKLSILSLYPNPAQQAVTVVMESREAWAGAPLQVFDARGALISEHFIDLEKGINQLQIDISKFTEGIYLVMIPNGNNQQKAMRRFVKVNR